MAVGAAACTFVCCLVTIVHFSVVGWVVLSMLQEMRKN